jgi:hypothetical protein
VEFRAGGIPPEDYFFSETSWVMKSADEEKTPASARKRRVKVSRTIVRFARLHNLCFRIVVEPDDVRQNPSAEDFGRIALLLPRITTMLRPFVG